MSDKALSEASFYWTYGHTENDRGARYSVEVVLSSTKNAKKKLSSYYSTVETVEITIYNNLQLIKRAIKPRPLYKFTYSEGRYVVN